jgi:hypothetical protein
MLNAMATICRRHCSEFTKLPGHLPLSARTSSAHACDRAHKPHVDNSSDPARPRLSTLSARCPFHAAEHFYFCRLSHTIRGTTQRGSSRLDAACVPGSFRCQGRGGMQIAPALRTSNYRNVWAKIKAVHLDALDVSMGATSSRGAQDFVDMFLDLNQQLPNRYTQGSYTAKCL